MTHPIPRKTFQTSEAASQAVAQEIATLIRGKPKPVLGLATGGTPLKLYAELIRLHREEGLSFAHVTTFNLDEYCGLDREHPQSYWNFMWRHLFDHIDIDPANVHLPSGTVAEQEINNHCAAYEAAIMNAGGIDYQVLGIGRTGHIGFNEPGSAIDSKTRHVLLDPITREDAAKDFGGIEQVPTGAITMGCGTILSARRIALLAFGAAKAAVVDAATTGPVTDQLPASFLQQHPATTFFVDQELADAS
ncbi:glucosamine-6-phosphate deaminase [Luteolibacter pohnpeiensis]|uniref:Glucosamine-6-phosphate deaminase n=1 Tax=Luteolibacter pohnpeiensis TaxID=454153 RepID=A0A934S486_9BACT|nr:glucosamine-6-phosphate deaminase [Luteolibacter pohnpeiensis]MBK1882865.1 glucosamine-6-phosphate deaminase [Luteolibacter pohnpeiensis]